MDQYFYQRRYEKKVVLDSFVHEVSAYRYNWHPKTYEIDIVLRGSLEFYQDGRKYLLKQDDIVAVNPKICHASFALEPNTTTLVLHFPARVFRPLLEDEQICDFHIASDDASRNEARYRYIRFYCAQLLRAMAQDDICSNETACAAFKLLQMTLFTMCDKTVIDCRRLNEREADSEIMEKILKYVDSHYTSKLQLKDMAAEFGYNRTYFSTFFKRNTGLGFYEYLTNARLQHAIWDLYSTDTNMTKIALYNGFPDLKTFNRLFEDNFHMTPAEYRLRLPDYLVRQASNNTLFRKFQNPQDPDICAKLDEYMLM